ncbi:MAG: phage tail tape measure protein, partial [Ruminococcus sp.]|nr:phage tail tape measure protein [Ruminococcus sp.]
LTVEIGGDTTKLGKAIDDSKKKSKSLQTELKQVEKLLKLDPKNVELVAQKQKILAEQVEETKKRLSLLKDEQSKVNEMYRKGEIGEEDYRKYRRDVEQTEITLKNLETQLKTTGDQFAEMQRKSGAATFRNAENKVEHFKGKVKDMTDAALENAQKLSEGFDKVGDGLEKAGSVLNKGSAAAAAVLAGSVAAFKDLDDGYDVIVKKTGAANEKFDSLKKTADELFSGSTFDMTAIGNAIGEVNTRFGFTEDKLRSVTEQYLQFAKINDADVSDSVSKTARIMQAWNLSAENLPDLLGMITAKGQETGAAVGSLMDKVLDNNATFKEMGLSLEESIALMAQFEKNGVNDSTALTAMKAAVKNAAKEGKSLSEWLTQTVDDIKNASSETEALQKATELFGTKGAAEMANAIREGRINFDKLSGSMTEYKDTVKNTYTATLDPLEESKQVLNNLKLAGADLAATALKEGQPLIDDVIKGIKGITDWFKKLDPEQQKVLTKAIEITAVVGPGVTILGKLTKGVGSFVGTGAKMVKSLQNTTVAQMGLNAAMDANPVGAVTLAITAFVAVLGGAITAINAFHDAQLENAGFKQQLDDMQETVDKIS